MRQATRRRQLLLLAVGASSKSIFAQHPHLQLRRRQTMYLPPAPVAPFRGGLKSVPKGDDQEDDDKIESSEDDVLLEANSSVPTSGHSLSSSTLPASWAPEDYPDPWTNPLICGGAATASLMDQQNQPQQQAESQMRRPMFCDPDKVLDKETLRDVAVKLRAFAETFASSDVLGGGDFGTDNEEPEINDQNLEENPQPSETDVQNQEEVPLQPSEDTFSTDEEPLGQDRKLPIRRLWSTLPSEKGLYSNSVGGLFSATHRDHVPQRKELVEEQKIEVAIALVQKINLPAILRADSYFFYSDQDDMVNDAAQYFARYIHDTWSKRLAEAQKASNADTSLPTNIVLIFISTLDRICYISSGTRVASILPWWRLEHVVQDMKQDLRKGKTGDALFIAIEDLTALLLDGPPSFADRVNDFFQRFGIVMLFTIFTFVFATWGECRDRRKRLFFADRRSRLTAAEKEKARLLQKEFRTKTCPICLESFDLTPGKEPDTYMSSLDKNEQRPKQMKRVDSYGIPLIGTDEEPVKMLRCGHIFDSSCWSMWVDSGQGNPFICPVCRQDVGRTKRGQRNAEEGGNRDDIRGNEEENPSQESSSLFARIVSNTTRPSTLRRPANRSHPHYSSVQSRMQQRPLRRQQRPFAPLSHPTFLRLHPRVLGFSSALPIEGLSEQTPLFAQTHIISSEDDDDYYII